MLTPFWGSIVIPLLTGDFAKLRTKHIQSDDGVKTPDAGMDRFSTTAEPKGVCWVGSFFKDVWLQRYVKETVKTKMDQQANHDVVYRET